MDKSGTREFGNHVSWDTGFDTSIYKIAKLCQMYETIHTKCGVRMQSTYDRLMYFSMFVAPISSVISTVSSYFSDKYQPVFLVTANVSAFLSALCVSIIKYGRHKELSESHKVAAGEYLEVYNMATRELSLPEHARTQPLELLNTLNTRCDSLFQNSPLVDIENKPSPSIPRRRITQKENAAFSNQYTGDILFINDMVEYEIGRNENHLKNFDGIRRAGIL